MTAAEIALETGVPPRPLVIDQRAAELLGEAFLRERQIVPYALSGGVLYVATADTHLATIGRAVQQRSGYHAAVRRELPDLIEQALVSHFSAGALPQALDRQVASWLVALGSTTDRPVRGHDGPDATGELERLEAVSLAADLPMLRLERWRLRPELARLLPEPFVRARRALPVLYLTGVLYVAVTHAADRSLSAELEGLLGCRVRLVLAGAAAVERTIEAVYVSAAQQALRRSDRVIPTRRGGSLSVLRPQTDAPRPLMAAGAHGSYAALYPSSESLLRRATEHGLEAVRAAGLTSRASLAALLPRGLADRLNCLVLSIEHDRARIAVAGEDPLADAATVAELLDRPVEPLLADRGQLAEAIGKAYRGASTPPLPPPPAALLLRHIHGLDPAVLSEAEGRATRTGETVAEVLIDTGVVDQIDLAEAEGLRHATPWLWLQQCLPSADTLATLSAEQAEQFQVLPLRRQGGFLHAAVKEPTVVERLQRATGLVVRPILAAPEDIVAAVDRFYGSERRPEPLIGRLFDSLQTQGRLNRRQRVAAYTAYAVSRLPADVALTNAGAGGQYEVAALLAGFSGVPLVDLRPPASGGTRVEGEQVASIDPTVARLLPFDAARRLGALPLRLEEQRVVVAVADPLDTTAIEQVRAAVGRPLQLCVSPRGGLEAAIRRLADRRNLGDHLVELGSVAPDELVQAVELHERTGVPIGKALLTLGLVTQEQLAQVLSDQLDLPYFEIRPEEVDAEAVRQIPEELARRRGVLPIAVDDDSALIAVTEPLDREALEEVAAHLQRPITVTLTTERRFNAVLDAVYRAEYVAKAANDLLERSPEDSAFHVLSKGQKVSFSLIGLALLGGFALNYILTLTVLVSLAIVFYFSFSAYKLYLIYKALATSLEVVVTPDQLAELDDHELPVYSVIVPLYKEGDVLPVLVDALDRLDYPKTKLEILLLLEEDDLATIQAARAMRLPEGVCVLVVPHGQPKGKPKACNYGLLHARGEFIVLYDAEDVPEPDQLKKALIAFRDGGERLVTVQAKLNYFNRDQNLLTRWFTSEYAMWFDLLLPGLDNSGAPIPLGGTSNHFRTGPLRELGGWDPYNVTEDADLGIRLFKKGYRTAVINSTTYEEANSNVYNWIRQRSRWIKGYMQTWLVHMRHPIRLLRAIGLYPFISLQLIIAGTFFSFLANPIFWGVTGLWFLTHWSLIQRIFPGPIFYLGAISLYCGNFAFVYINVAGALRREYHHLVKYTLLTPIYWLLMSVAAWKALYQLVSRPSYWEKTEHGLYRGRVKVPGQAPVRRTP